MTKYLALGLILVATALPVSSQAQDNDGDGVLDTQDNCIDRPNPDQRDADLDGYGSLCDGDYDNSDLEF